TRATNEALRIQSCSLCCVDPLGGEGVAASQTAPSPHRGFNPMKDDLLWLLKSFAIRHGSHCNFQGAAGMATQRPQRQNIKTIESHAGSTHESHAGSTHESHAGSTQAMPDNRVLLTL